MIVDDDSLIRWGLSKHIPGFCNFPIEIKAIDNGTDAANEISSSFYDLCFLDIHLPDLNGIEVMKKIKEVSPETEVVIMTANDLDSDVKAEVEEMAYQFIPKPFDFYQVRFILKHALEGNGLAGRSTHREKRRSKRRQFNRPFDYSIKAAELKESNPSSLKGNIIDISDGGMGIITDYSLHAGQMLEINGIEQRTGVVKWITMMDSKAFRAGIEFVLTS
jgi:CheY-like chemotaxis protein